MIYDVNVKCWIIDGEKLTSIKLKLLLLHCTEKKILQALNM